MFNNFDGLEVLGWNFKTSQFETINVSLLLDKIYNKGDKNEA